MRSPFTQFANTTITVLMDTGVVSTNTVGNRTTRKSPVQLLAMLKPVNDTVELQYYVGDDDSATLMEGYLVEPLVLPPGLYPPEEGTAAIKIADGRVETGKFKLLPSMTSPYLVAVKINFLNRIRGIFTRT